MTRHTLHAGAVARLCRRLRSHGYHVERTAQPGGVELVVNGYTCAVRVSTPKLRKHDVHGGRYSYFYRADFWNLHQHNELHAHPDLWLLMTGSDVYVVPASLLHGRTVSLMHRTGTGPRRPAMVRQYLGRFDLLERRRGRRAA